MQDVGEGLARQPQSHVPNTRETGLDAGKGIADDCKADPDALLFADVDKHVRRVAGAANRVKERKQNRRERPIPRVLSDVRVRGRGPVRGCP